jgi:murein L,D-transpeptidase YafK
MKKLFLLFSIVASLYSATILDIYRKNGMEKIEPLLDKALTKESYWKKVMQKSDTRFGYTEQYDAFLVCDKSNSTLMFYKKEKGSSYSLYKQYKAYTGKNKGDKQFEGDLKTPVGIYNLTNKLSKVDSFYGPMAFVTSYPNLYDRYKGKDGHGIWIHGLPINQTRDEYTKGCIAIDNDGLQCLEKNINLDKTALLIYESKEVSSPSKETLAKIAAWLYKWRFDWKYNDISSYLSHYSQDFKRWDGKNFDQFKRYKARIFSKNEPKSIIFNSINILPYPNHPDMYQITFMEHYKSPSFTFDGNKELLIRIENGKIKIFSEQ